MKAGGTDLVSAALVNPHSLPAWPLPQWDKLVRQARHANVMGRLDAVLTEHSLSPQVPSAVRPHLDSARVLAQAHRAAVRREVNYIVQALEQTGTEIVLLKGAAYIFAELPAANGRVFADIDVLVPKNALKDVETQLTQHGWTTGHHDPYDQRYYREWMHELPPMQHADRDTVIDVHHAILPQTARLKPDSAKLLAASEQVGGNPRLRVLAPVDMVLHSATHLFQNEEMSNGFRDLADLDSLLRHFGHNEAFWPALAARAAEMDLLRPLYYGLRYARQILHTPMPPAAASADAHGAPPRILQRFLDALWMRALRPQHPTVADSWTPMARALVYVRAHWLRMPPHLLAYHFAHKAFASPKEEPAKDAAK